MAYGQWRIEKIYSMRFFYAYIPYSSSSILTSYDILIYRTIMPHLSKNILSPQKEMELLKTFDIILARITKADEMKTFLLTLLTPTERLMLAKRLMIAVLLKENLNETNIAEILHVTRGTVYKSKLFLEARGEGYEVAFKVLNDVKLKEELKSVLLSFAKYSIRASSGRIKA